MAREFLTYEYPELYVFIVKSRNEKIKHIYENCYKIGDTIRGSNIRAKEWQDKLRLLHNDYTLTVDVLATFPLIKDINERVSPSNFYIRDYFIHKELVQRYNCLQLNEYDKLGSNEFFKIPFTIETLKTVLTNIIKDVFKTPEKYNVNPNTCKVEWVELEQAYVREKTFCPRFYQIQCIKKLVNILFEKNEDRFCIEFSCRGGKTNTGLWVVSSNSNKIEEKLTVGISKYYKRPIFTLVLTAQPSVKEEWRKDAQEHKDYESIIFAYRKKDDLYLYWKGEPNCKNNIETPITAHSIFELKELGIKLNKNIMLFLSIQDFTGSSTDEENIEDENIDINNIKTRYKTLFSKSNIVDLLMIDEAHNSALNTENKSSNILEQLVSYQNCKRIDITATPYKAKFNGIYDDHNSFVFDIKEFLKKIPSSLIEKEWYTKWKEEFPNMYTICPKDSNEYKNYIEKIESGTTKNRIQTAYILVKKLLTDFDSGLGLLNNKTIIETFSCMHSVISVSNKKTAAIIADAFDIALKELNKKDYKISLLTGHTNNHNITNDFECANDWKEWLSKNNNDNKKTISITVNKWLTGNTLPELDCFIWLRSIKSAEMYVQFSNRIFNPFNTDISIKENVLVWNWNKQSLFMLTAWKKGLIKSDDMEKTNKLTNFGEDFIDMMLEDNNIIQPSSNIPSEYIYVNEKNINEVIDFIPEEYKNLQGLTKLSKTQEFSLLSMFEPFVEPLKEYLTIDKSGNFKDSLYEDVDTEDTEEYDTDKNKHKIKKDKTQKENRKKKNNNVLNKYNENIKYKYYIIDAISFIVCILLKNKIAITNCDDFIISARNIEDIIDVPSFISILNSIEKMKTNQYHYNLLTDSIRSMKDTIKPSYYNKFLEKYHNY